MGIFQTYQIEVHLLMKCHDFNETKPFISINVALKSYHPTCIVLGMALPVENKSVH